MTCDHEHGDLVHARNAGHQCFNWKFYAATPEPAKPQTKTKPGEYFRSPACVCGSKAPHYVPPSLGEDGFYLCRRAPSPKEEP